LFVLVLDPFLELLERANGIRELTRAFADDIAQIVSSLSSLNRIFAIFKLAAQAANLRLNPKKCVFIILGAPLTAENEQKLRNFLRDNVPGWEGVIVASCGKYLGFMVGPAAGAAMWGAAVGKWSTRALAIAAGKLAPSLGASVYNQRALTTMGYIAQLAPPDKRALRIEKSLVQKVYHVANHTFPKAFLFRGRSVHLPQFGSLQAMSYAARFRAATSTIPRADYERNLTNFNEARGQFGSLAVVFGLKHRMQHWDSDPMILAMRTAEQGFSDSFPGLLEQVRCQLQKQGQERSRVSRQKLAYNFIVPKLFPSDFVTDIVRRIRLWLSPEHPGQSANIANPISMKLQVLKDLPVCVSVSVHKVWFNGLATAYRRHLPARPCLVCQAKNSADRLLHIAHCPVLWSVIANVLRTHVPTDPLDQLAIDNSVQTSASDQLIRLHILCEVYQGLADKPASLEHLFALTRDAVRRVRMLTEPRPPPRPRASTRDRGTASHADTTRNGQSFSRQAAPQASRSDQASAEQAFAAGVRMPVSFGGLA